MANFRPTSADNMYYLLYFHDLYALITHYLAQTNLCLFTVVLVID